MMFTVVMLGVMLSVANVSLVLPVTFAGMAWAIWLWRRQRKIEFLTKKRNKR